MQATHRLLLLLGLTTTASSTDERCTLSTDSNQEAYSINGYRNVFLGLTSLIILLNVVFLLLFYRYLSILHQRETRRPRATLHRDQGQSRAASDKTGRVFKQDEKEADKPSDGARKARRKRGHLMVVLGSGGHTAEMMRILHTLGAEYLCTRFARRTYVISTGDGFSAERARRFEEEVLAKYKGRNISTTATTDGINNGTDSYEIVTVTRARKVHQSLLTTPVSSLTCLYDCTRVLRGTHPDQTSSSSPYSHLHSNLQSNSPSYPNLILANGPATSTILILASFLLQFLGIAPLSPPTPNSSPNSTADLNTLRTVYIESFARVKTLSLSGEIIRRTRLAKVLVQWPRLAEQNRGVENIGIVVS